MNRDKKIDYIEFNATDLAQIKAFYSGVFDWTFVDYGPDYTSFSDGRIAGGFQKGTVVKGSTLVVIFVADLSETEKRVVNHGGTITRDIFSFPGGSRFHFTDPSGNELAAWLDSAE